MQTNPIALRRAAVVTAGAAIAYLVIRHVIAVHSALDGGIDTDEVEYLHAGWLMHQGLRLYRDFSEDHAPFLFVILKWMVPSRVTAAFPRLDLVSFVTRARIFSSTLGLFGLGAVAALSYRAMRSLVAPLVTIAVIMSSPWVWLRGVVQIRNDPPALFLFWTGALLMLIGRRSERVRFLCAGIGIGLIGVAFLWNPKWPLETLIFGGVYLAIVWRAFRRDPRMLALTVVPPAVCLGVAVLCIVRTVSFSDYFFFTFRYNKLLGDWMAADPFLTRLAAEAGHDSDPFVFCPPAFKGIWPVIAIVFTIALLSMKAMRQRLDGKIDLNILRLFLALAAAAMLEIRFLYPYPNVWTQYYVVWGFVLGCLYGTTTAALLRLLPNDAMRLAATVAIALLAAFGVEQALSLRASVTGWPTLSYLQRKLRPGETVWVFRHPIGAPDGGYYWFAALDLVPFSIQYAARHPGQTPLPNITERDLPVCRAERGLQPNLRFVSGRKFLHALPEAERCLDRIIAAGRAIRTPVDDVWDLHPDQR